MTKIAIWIFGGILGVGLMVWANLSNEFTAETDQHTHVDHPTDDHMHTHLGPFSHDHTHVGLPDGTTHSHPHKHRHQHQTDQNLEAAGWSQVGHEHDENQTVYFARCQQFGQQFKLEFLACSVGRQQEFLLPQSKLAAEVYVGTKRLGSLYFESQASHLFAMDEDSLLNHPILSLVVSNVQLGTETYDLVLPVQRNEMQCDNLLPTNLATQ